METRKAVALLALLAVDGRQSRDLPAARLWVEHDRRELCSALDRLTRAEVEQDELDAATSHAGRWLATDPLNEQVHGRLMLLHARHQRAEAIQRYPCVALLDRELGVRPLEQAERAGDRQALEGGGRQGDREVHEPEIWKLVSW